MKFKSFALALSATSFPFELWAGRPLVVDDAYTVALGKCEVEAGFYFDNRAELHYYEVPFGITVGLLKTLEASVGFPSHVHNEELTDEGQSHSGIGDLVLGLKWNPLGQTNCWASHGFALGIKIPTANAHQGLGSGKVDCDLIYIASRNFSERLSAHLNVGYAFVGNGHAQRSDDVLHSGVAIGYFATTAVELVGEIYSDLYPFRLGDAASLRGGLRWAVCDSLILDAAIGAGLHGPAPAFLATTGLTWSFGFRQKRD